MKIDLTDDEIKQITRTHNKTLKDLQHDIRERERNAAIQKRYEEDAPKREAIRNAIDAGLASIDPWCSGEIGIFGRIFSNLQIRSGVFTYKNTTYLITYSPAGGRGMGEYPEHWTIQSTETAIIL